MKPNPGPIDPTRLAEILGWTDDPELIGWATESIRAEIESSGSMEDWRAGARSLGFSELEIAGLERVVSPRKPRLDSDLDGGCIHG